MTRFQRSLLAAALALAAVHASAQTLRFRLLADPPTLYNVQTNTQLSDGVLGNYLLERLVYIDGQGRPQPWLAESWTLSPDQKVVTFKLRSGIRFHDGTSFDAAAVKAHFDAVRDPRNASPNLPLLGPLGTVETPDAMTVRLVFNKPYGSLFTHLALSFMGINSPSAVQKSGKTYGRKPVGTGPYKLVKWIPGTEIRLERYADWKPLRADTVNQGAPRAETVLLRVIREDSVAAAAMESGELTAAALTPDAVTRFEKNPAFRLDIDRNVRQVAFLDMNQRRPPFDNADFRRAVSHSLDRASIVRGAFGGYATPMVVPLAPGIAGHDKALAAKGDLGYDPAKARALFQKAGFKLEQGLLVRNGQPLQLLLRGVAGSDPVDRALAVMQSNLKAVGIEARIETSDWGAFYPALLKDDWDLALMGWTWPDGSVLGNLWHSPGHRRHLPANPELDAVLDRCDATVAQAPREACLHDAQRLLVERTVVIPLYSRWDLTALKADVRDYTIDALGYLLPGDVRVAP